MELVYKLLDWAKAIGLGLIVLALSITIPILIFVCLVGGVIGVLYLIIRDHREDLNYQELTKIKKDPKE